MGSILSSLDNYLILIGLALLTGIIYWVFAKFRIGAALVIILSLAGPILVLLLAAQRVDSTPVYEYIMAEISNGNTWARLAVLIHVYLIGWLLFILISSIIKFVRSPWLKEKVEKFRTSNT
ncbi:hypothetical protein [Oceanobacillus sp. CAU 1775]